MRRSDGWWAGVLVAMLAGAAVAQEPGAHALAERSGSWERVGNAAAVPDEVTAVREPEPTSSSTMPGPRKPLRPPYDEGVGASASLSGGEDRDPVWGYWYERHNLVRPLRTLATLGGGAVGMVAGGLIGAGLFFPLFCLSPRYCGTELLAGAALGALAGQPLGTWLTGNLLNGDGNLWATVGGTAAGLALAYVLHGIVQRSELIPVMVYGGPLVLSSIVYELTSKTSASSVRAGGQVRLVPMIGPSRRGAAPGLALGGTW